MSRYLDYDPGEGDSSPHTRGDVPRGRMTLEIPRVFSPHAWGCPGNPSEVGECLGVLTTRVGMSRNPGPSAPMADRSPHTRGDVPYDALVRRLQVQFSPHAWGCPGSQVALLVHREVLPTRVGMSRRGNGRHPREGRSPHTRGDVPHGEGGGEAHPRFSPHAWGCPVATACRIFLLLVLPTRVGMSRGATVCSCPRSGSPHTRGDVPTLFPVHAVVMRFSPHAWGCPGDWIRAHRRRKVLPTRVGMSRERRLEARRSGGSPHTRGDVPSACRSLTLVWKFSPHAWGCPELRVQGVFVGIVLPTRVGMSRRARPRWPGKWRSPHTRGDVPR